MRSLFKLALIVALVLPCFAQIGFNSATVGTVSGAGTLTFAHTNSSPNDALFVCAGTRGDSVTGITYNGNAMTKIASLSNNAGEPVLLLGALLHPGAGIWSP